jgi:gas vesicle protein
MAQQRTIDDPMDPWSAGYRRRAGSGAGSLLLAMTLGVGIGLLAAPQPGSKTRKQLRKRLAALGEGFGGSLEEVQELSSRARKQAKQRLARLREDAGDELQGVGERWQKAKGRFRDLDLTQEDEDSGSVGTLLAIAAGVAATYFLTSDRAATVRSRVQGAASDMRRRATDQWDRFQRGGIGVKKEGSTTPAGQAESRAGTTSTEDVPPTA